MIVTGRILKTAANAAIAMIVALVTSSGVCFAQTSTKAQTSSPTASTQNVNVVNTPTVNVGTLPAVTVIGTPAVSAAQSGSWNVGITGIPGVQVTNTIAQAVPTLTAGPSLVTHMGQLPSSHVNLVSISGTSCSQWFRIASDGQGSLFTIPAGDVLVITDVEFEDSSFAAGSYHVNLDVGGSGVLGGVALVDASGWLVNQHHLTSGIVVSSLPTCGITGTSASPSARIYGYLIQAN